MHCHPRKRHVNHHCLSSSPSSRLRRLFLVCSHESARQQGYEVCKGRRISLIRLKKKKNARREPFQIHHHLKKVSDPPPASRTFTEISANVWKENPSTPKRSVCLQSRLSLFCRIKTVSIILPFFSSFCCNSTRWETLDCGASSFTTTCSSVQKVCQRDLCSPLITWRSLVLSWI